MSDSVENVRTKCGPFAHTRNEVVAGEQYDLDIGAVEEELRRREAALVASRTPGAPR